MTSLSAVNWHRDSVNRRLGEGGDWDESEEPYRLARVGFYPQSHAESRFAPGRHFARHQHYHRHVRDELGYSALDPELVERLRRAGLHADADPLSRDPEASTCRPGQLQKLLGRRIRPGARAA